MTEIVLCKAEADDYPCIENLMQFYVYDFSEWLPLPFNDEGCYTLSPKADYWAKPGTQAFLIEVDGELAGFVTVDDEVHDADTQHNIGYLFIGRRFRGQGVGRAVVQQVLARFPGRWQIFHVTANRPAALFWARLVPDVSGGVYASRAERIDGWDCTLYRFAV